MIEIERMVAKLRTMPRADVIACIKRWSLIEHTRRKTAEQILIEDGWEPVDVDDDALLTPDGRPINRNAGRPMAQRHDVIAERKARMAAEARQRARKPEPEQRPGESLTSVLCPACQSAMAKAPVCPKCAKGKAGFKILCQCTECAHEVYL